MRAEISDIESFVNIVKSGSLSRASVICGVPKATLSYRLRRLEQALGAELFLRTGKDMRLTEAGRKCFSQCQEVVMAYHGVMDSTRTQHESLDGNVRIGAYGDEFGTSLFGPLIANLAHVHPGLHIEFETGGVPLGSFNDMPFDCYVCTGTPPDCDLVQRSLGALPYGLFAGAGYLSRYGAPHEPDELDSHQSIVLRRLGELETWRLRCGDMQAKTLPPSQAVVASYWMAKYLAMRDLGIAYLPVYFAENEVQRDFLRPVLPDWQDHSESVYVLYHRQRYQPKKLQAVVKTLIDSFPLIQLMPGYLLVDH